MDRRRVTSLLLGLLAVILVTPNVISTLQAEWKSYLTPFSYDLKVPIPLAPSSLATAQVYPPYGGIQTYQLPGLSAIDEDIKQVPIPSDVSLSIHLERNEVPVGDNVTLTVSISWTKKAYADVGLYVFVIDPQKIVRGAFPNGKIPFIYLNSLPYPNLSNVRNPMQSGRVAFTFGIPETSLSTGQWSVYVLGFDLTGGSTLAWTATSFSVIQRPQVTLSLFSEGLRALGTFGLVYGIANTYYDSVVSGSRLLKKNWAFLLGVVLIVGYLFVYFYSMTH